MKNIQQNSILKTDSSKETRKEATVNIGARRTFLVPKHFDLLIFEINKINTITLL